MVLGCEIACATTTDPAAFVQELETSIEAVRSVRVQGGLPVVVFGARGAFEDRWDIVSVYLMLERQPGDAGPPRRWWMARRVSSNGSKSGPPDWADTRSCPGLANAMGGLDSVTAVAVPLAGNAHLTAPPRAVADGVLVTLWSDQGRQAGNWPVRILISTFGGPLADWGQSTLKATASCWSREQPGA